MEIFGSFFGVLLRSSRMGAGSLRGNQALFQSGNDRHQTLSSCNKAVELDIPVLISPSMMDPRQAHWMDTNESISLNQVLELAEKVDKLTIIKYAIRSRFLYDLLFAGVWGVDFIFRSAIVTLGSFGHKKQFFANNS